jgi:hypothetical protein
MASITFERLDVLESGFGRTLPGLLEHLRQEVQRNDLAGLSGPVRGHHSVDAGTTPEVQDRLAPLDVRVSKMVVDAQSATRGRPRHARQLLAGVEHRRHCARVLVNVTIRISHQCLELFAMHQVLCHPIPPNNLSMS